MAWITEPLDGTDLTAAAWVFHIWAKESAAAANAALRFQVFAFTNAEAGTALLDDNNGTELTAAAADYARTTGNATITTMADGDRLVIKILLDDAGTMAASQTVTASYNGQYARAEGDSYVTCPDTLAVTVAMPTATRTHVRQHVKDTAATNPLLTNAEIDQAFVAAVRSYSRDRPRVVADYLSGDGSAYQFVLPRYWIHSFSRVEAIEYPVGNQPRTWLEPADYEVRETVLGPQPLRRVEFLALVPDSGTDNLLLYYTTRHTHNDELDTIPSEDFEPVTWLAASYAAATLSAKYAAFSEGTITVDSVSYRDGQIRWKQVAEHFAALYNAYIRGSGTVQPTGSTTDWDTNLQPYGRDRLFHRRRWR